MKWLKKRLPLWFDKRSPRVEPEELERLATESMEITDGQKSEVNRMSKTLGLRNAQNHFGEEFHVSFRPRES